MVTSTEELKKHIHNKPISSVNVSLLPSMNNFKTQQKVTTSSTSVQKSIISNDSNKQKNEIYVDIIEKLTVAYNFDGFILHSEVNGKIQMKNYLIGNPSLKLALNDDLSLENCNFHRCVDVSLGLFTFIRSV